MHKCDQPLLKMAEQFTSLPLRQVDVHSHLDRNAASFLLPHRQTLPLVLPQGGSHPLQMAIKDIFLNT